MAKETQLNKEFQERDVKRLRNLISGKYGDKTKTQIGFEVDKNEYKEGDVWEENKKTWTIINGIKQTISKLDHFRKLNELPLKCPNCSQSIKNTELNKKMYIIHKMCSDCVFEMESKLKIEGKFQEYEKNMMNNNRLSLLDEFDEILTEYVNSVNEVFVTEDGDIERWIGGGVDVEYVKKMKNFIKEQKIKKI